MFGSCSKYHSSITWGFRGLQAKKRQTTRHDCGVYTVHRFIATRATEPCQKTRTERLVCDRQLTDSSGRLRYVCAKFSDLFVERYLSAGKPGEIIFNYSFFQRRVLV